jgi:transposase-like protein
VSTLDHRLEPEVTTVRRLEVITGVGRRRRFTEDLKARVVEETLAPDAVVSEVARRHGLTPQQVFTWRRQARTVAADRERSPDVRAGRCGNGIAIPASTQKATPADAPGGSELRKHRG